MPRGLVLLYLLMMKGRIRRTFRGLSRPRNLLMFLVGFAVFGGYLVMIVLSQALTHVQFRPDTALVRLYAPPAMLGLFLLSAINSLKSPGFYFLPAEIELLFPAPVSRRALVIYKLAGEATLLVIMSLVMAIFLRSLTASYPNAAIGVLLFFLLNNLCLRVLCLLAAGARERLLGRAYAAASVAALLAVAAVAAVVFMRAQDPARLGEALRSVLRSEALRVAAAPFVVATEVLLAPTAVDLLRWGATGAAFVAVALWVVLRLDVDYREASVATSRRMQERLDRMRRASPVIAMSAGGARVRGTLPMFPRWGGAGAIVWRQAIALLRNLRGLLFLMVIVALSVSISFFAASRERGAAVGALVSLGTVLTVMGALLFRFDFRGDLESMEALRALPVAPLRMAIGQLLMPTIVVTVLDWIVCGAAVWLQPQAWPWIAGAAVLVPLGIGLLIAIENLAFLYYPIRLTPTAGFDFQHIGRNVVLRMVEFFAMAFVGGIVAGAGALAWFVTGGFVPAVILAAGSVLVVFLVATIFLVGHAFSGFDVSRDIG